MEKAILNLFQNIFTLYLAVFLKVNFLEKVTKLHLLTKINLVHPHPDPIACTSRSWRMKVQAVWSSPPGCWSSACFTFHFLCGISEKNIDPPILAFLFLSTCCPILRREITLQTSQISRICWKFFLTDIPKIFRICR